LRVIKALHLKKGDPLPFEAIEMHLCRDVYHCLPSQLAEEDWFDVAIHLKIIDIESRIPK